MLTTTDAVALILGRTFTVEEAARASELIAMVQADIEARLGREAETVTVVDAAFTVPVRQSRLLLPHWPLASVTATSEDGTVLTADDWAVDLPTGIITRLATGHPAFWDPRAGAVAVSYVSQTIADLANLCARIVARAFTAAEDAAAQPVAMAGLRQLTIGRWSATADTSTRADPIGSLQFTDIDTATIDSWRDRRS